MAMEQQIDPQELVKKSLWLHQVEDDDEEEEVGVGLLARHSRHPSPTDGDGITPASASGELEPALATAPNNGAITEHSGHEEEEAAAAYGVHRHEEVGGDNKQDEVGSAEVHGNSVCFDELQGTETINGISEMKSEIAKIPSMEISQQRAENLEDQNISGLSPALVERLHEEGNTSFKHLETEMKVDTNVDLFGDIEEDLMELDVERVLAKQNTHDLYCPKCNSCITRKVILIRRKAKVLKPHKSKRGQKLDQIPSSAGFGRTDDTPETHSNVSPVAAPDEQNNGREQEQEAFSCLSCFSIFIPIGNGCFKIFQFFRQGRQNIQSPQQINLSEDTQSPQEISQNDNTETPPTISNDEDTQSPQKRSQNVNMDSPQRINHNADAQNPQLISGNEDTQSPQEISCNENKRSPQDINENESKQSPQKMPTAGHASSVQSAAAVPIPSVINRKDIDGAAIKPKEPGITNIFSSTNSSLLDKVKADFMGKEPAVDMFQRNVGDNGIKDIETGLLDPRTDAAPLSEGTQTEGRGVDAGEGREWEILKSIVYGGLVESITSLGVVSSAAGAGADTLNVLALGLANLIGGLIIIFHNLRELKNDQPRGGSTEINVEEDRYQALLGRRQNFVRHVIVAILSFLVFGLVPPVVYGFSFRKSDDKDLKLAAVAGASLVCIIWLALGKGHVRNRTYFRTASYYVITGITASGISYLVGELIKKLLEQLGLFESSSAINVPFLESVPMELGRASY